MPTYEYRCDKCGEITEEYRKVREPQPPPTCIECGGPTQHKISLPNATGVKDWKPYYDAGLGVVVSRGQDVDARLNGLAKPRQYTTINPFTGQVVVKEEPGKKLVRMDSVRGGDPLGEDRINSALNERKAKLDTLRARNKELSKGRPFSDPMRRLVGR